MSVVTRTEFTRSDLPIPLPPVRGFSLIVRRYLVGLRTPRFAGAYRVTIAVALAGIMAAVAAFLVPSAWQKPLVGVSTLLGLYVIIRVTALVIFEVRQNAFQAEWIAAQSQVLQNHAFEVLRFSVQDITSAGGGTRYIYDLTRQSDVSVLLRRQEGERASGRLSRVTVEFTYLTADGTLAVAEVHRELPELTFLAGWARSPSAWIRFPEARYLSRPGPSRHPSQRTFWALLGRVLITVGESVYDPAEGRRTPTASATGSGPGSTR